MFRLFPEIFSCNTDGKTGVCFSSHRVHEKGQSAPPRTAAVAKYTPAPPPNTHTHTHENEPQQDQKVQDA